MVAVLSASRPRDGDVPSWICQTQDTTVAVRSCIGLRAALALLNQGQNGSNDGFEFGDLAEDGGCGQPNLPCRALDEGVLRLLETVEQRWEVGGGVVHPTMLGRT